VFIIFIRESFDDIYLFGHAGFTEIRILGKIKISFVTQLPIMSEDSTRQGYVVLVTGGSGFLGSALIRELLDPATPLPVRSVRNLDLKPGRDHPAPGVTWIKGDVRDFIQVSDASREADLVIHSAAIVDWGTRSEEEVMGVNVEGTRNVIRAAFENRVRGLVFTSSLDVLFTGQPLREVDETFPYPEKHGSSYCVSKYLAEKLVLNANQNGLNTCSLRPADIYGEGDPYHIGNLINMARKGFYVRLGNGSAHCQHVYVGNAAHAHLLAAGELLKRNSRVAGEAYFITDGPGSNFFRFFDTFVEGTGFRIWPRNFWLPRGVAYTLGTISEWMAVLARPFKKYTPKMSRFAVTYTCTDYTFRSDKALKDFGFTPKYSDQEAYHRTVDYFRNQYNR
jgi:nucleoside-diphosphate-sugar epimerase